mgnify:CR=1 FL=1
MHYPLFEVPRLGGGMLIAIVAIFHVFVAHFAVGAGLFLAVGETVARRRGDNLLLRFLRDTIGALVLFSFVAGAVTGVGIWVTIGLVSPAATSALIHNFVWGWAIEWVFFFVEIAAGYVYYYGWDRLSPRRHTAVAWIYAIAAFMSLVIINGILTFMLTPGRWLELQQAGTITGEQAFWYGFFNPTYWPSLLLRTVSCLAIVALFAAVIVNLKPSYSREERHAIITFASRFLLPLGLMAPLAALYFLKLPAEVRALPLGGAIAMTLFLAFGLVMSLLIGFYAYFGLIRAKRYVNLETSVLLLLAAFVATGSMEFVREGIRKPYLIYGYLYSNQIPAAPRTADTLNRDGVLKHARFAWPPTMKEEDLGRVSLAERGRYVYQAQCRMCHEPGGTNAIEAIVPYASRGWVETTTRHLHEVRHYMPPFLGTEDELQALVEYQMELIAAERAKHRPDPAAPARKEGSR